MINIVTGSELKFENGEESVDMCKAIYDIREDAKLEGKLEGRLEGKLEGKLEERENLILKKIRKLKTLEQIAEELESEVEEIRPIYDRVKSAMV